MAPSSPNARDARETREKRHAVIMYEACFHEKVEDCEDVENPRRGNGQC